jgi:hypothetical protein
MVFVLNKVQEETNEFWKKALHGRRDWSQGASIRTQRARPMAEPNLSL